MSTLYSRSNSIIAIVCAATMAGLDNYFYKLDATGKAVPIAAVSDVPHGLILAVSADGMEISAAPLGGNHGTCRVKLGANVTDLRKDLTVRADGSAEPDDGAGPRVIVARPLELGSTDEEIECVLVPARVFGATVALASTDGTAAAAADLAGLKAETEHIGDDVRAIYAALVTAGFLS